MTFTHIVNKAAVRISNQDENTCSIINNII
jgi:hypothetical protein